MKLIVFSIFLILVAPTFVFSSEIDNIIKQQKESKKKEAEAGDKRERYIKAWEQCLDKITDVVALKIKELIDKGVQFKKVELYNNSFENIGGKRYAVYVDSVYGTQKTLVRTSMYEDRFIALQGITSGGGDLVIYFQPENGVRVSVTIRPLFNWLGTGEWELLSGKLEVIKFKSIYDINEIEKKRDMINNNIVKAIEAAIKYGDK